MGLFEIIFIGIGLSMDAFAASICGGIKIKERKVKYALIMALFFGAFQAIMPVIGYFAGKAFSDFIVKIDHYIAFILLSFLGGKLIVENILERKKIVECDCEKEYKFSYKETFVLAIATSIDALAVGVTFAFLKVNVLLSVSVIGLLTFALCIIGVFIGNLTGEKFKSKAEIFGGIVLILIGLKILLEHLGVLPF